LSNSTIPTKILLPNEDQLISFEKEQQEAQTKAQLIQAQQAQVSQQVQQYQAQLTQAQQVQQVQQMQVNTSDTSFVAQRTEEYELKTHMNTLKVTLVMEMKKKTFFLFQCLKNVKLLKMLKKMILKRI
jgi:seryl-tRNA synthetase